jgi:acyl carrier protein
MAEEVARKKRDGSLEERVYDIVSEQLGVEKSKLSINTSFVNDLGADSLDAVELVMNFEDEFDVSIPEADSEKLITIKEVIDYIEKHKLKQ